MRSTGKGSGARGAAIGVLLVACAASAAAQDKAQTLLEARRGFKTKLQRQERDEEPLEAPPPALFTIAKYRGPAGGLQAYVGAAPATPGKAPAMIWLTGGFPPAGAGPSAWEEPDLDNEQSARAYREAGLVMMYPTTRGTAGNPGVQEGFLGEVDDVLAALEHLRGLPYVDAERIYLGGHSTGATLALLVAACTDRFRAVFAFGPVAEPSTYGQDLAPYDVEDAAEARVRAPLHFLADVRSPTWIIEGAAGNSEDLEQLQAKSKNPALHFVPVAGSDHFELLSPTNRLIAKKLVQSARGGPELALTQAEVVSAFQADRVASRQSDDLRTLADVRREGVDLAAPVAVLHQVYADERPALEALLAAAKKEGFEPGPIEARRTRKGNEFFSADLKKTYALRDLDAVFAASATLDRLARAGDAFYGGWSVD